MRFGALSDLRVIDLTQMLAGPYATMMLADQGAEVIKVEPPAGDMTRPTGPFREDDTQRTHAGYFQSVNRNKKSVTLNLKSEAGRAALKALVKDADALCENFRVGVMDRLGLGYEVLREINPRLVYATIRGFGDPRTGRTAYTDWPAFDVVAQAMGGIMGITGPGPESPTKVGPGIGDLVPGLMLSFGIVSAIYYARRTGVGQFVDVAMVDSVLSVCERIVYQNSALGLVPGPEGNGHPFMSPFGMFPARDGHVTIAAPSQPFFETLCDLIDAPELKRDPRFASSAERGGRKDELNALIGAATARLTKAELIARLGGKIPFGPVMNVDDMIADPYFAARDMLVEIEQPGSATPLKIAGVPVKMTETPGKVFSRSPYAGEHNQEVLGAVGMNAAEIAAAQADVARDA